MNAENETKKVQLTSLTDVESPLLTKHGMLLATFVVHDQLLEPGQSVSVDDTPEVRRDASRYVQVGALAVGEIPEEYRQAAEKQQRAAKIEAAKGNKPKADKE